MLYSYNEILFGCKKEENFDTSYQMDGWKTRKDCNLYEHPRAVKFIELEEWCPSPRGLWIPETKVHNPALKIQFSKESGKWQLWKINSVWLGEEATSYLAFPSHPLSRPYQLRLTALARHRVTQTPASQRGQGTPSRSVILTLCCLLGQWATLTLKNSIPLGKKEKASKMVFARDWEDEWGTSV